MPHLSKLILVLLMLVSNLIAAPALYAAANNQANTDGSVLKKAENIKFFPAPGFPKGAQFVLIRGDLGKAVPYTIRLKLPDGYVIPAHWHATDEEITILSGTLHVGTGDKVDKSQSTALTAGGFQIVPANVHHYVWATGETVMQLDGMDPRTTVFVNPEEWATLIQKRASLPKQ